MDSLRFGLSLKRDVFCFSAAHFLVMPNGRESLHGHNFRVICRLGSRSLENDMVVDFLTVSPLLKDIVASFDHHILIPAKNPGLTFKKNGTNTEIRHDKTFFSFPTKDVILLPMPNTTCECLAAHIATEFKKSLKKIGAPPLSLVIEVEESPGLSAWCALEEA